MERVALIGLGVMGAGMGAQLLEAEYPLVVFNRSRERASALVKKGAQLASSPRDAAARADIINGGR